MYNRIAPSTVSSCFLCGLGSTGRIYLNHFGGLNSHTGPEGVLKVLHINLKRMLTFSSGTRT